MIFGVLWFLFTTYLRRAGWVEWALENPLLRIVRMRDLIVGEDLVEAGWQRWEGRRQKRKDILGKSS
jgi:dolichyldiphosphatase